MKVNADYKDAIKYRGRYLLLMGGAGSGKSVVATQKILQRIKKERGHRILVIRKVATTIKVSVWQLFKDLISQYNFASEFEFLIATREIKHIPTGNSIIFAGLDDQEKMKSIAGITSIWVEEATELSSLDFTQLDLRLRGETQNYKQIILTFNPIDEFHWLKLDFFDKTVENALVLRTTYVNNKFLDEDYIRLLTERMKANENLYRIYVQGEWGSASNGNEFYSRFKFSKHVQKVQYNETLPLHISFDFNVIPYITLIVAQVHEKTINVIDEICLEHPNSTTWKLCGEFSRKYSHHKAGLFVYGDPSGRARDTRSEGVEIKAFNDFTIIFKELAEFHPTDRVLRSAPPVKSRGDFINSVFESNFNDLEIKISEICKRLIQDFTYLKVKPDGAKLKEKEKDDSGAQFEKYGHTSDAFDYLLLSLFKDDFYIYQHGKPKEIITLKYR